MFNSVRPAAKYEPALNLKSAPWKNKGRQQRRNTEDEVRRENQTGSEVPYV